MNYREEDYGINLIFNISDSGIGIGAKDVDNLFGGFIQADAERNRKESGIGLGLAITKELVYKMNGTITMQSELGRGTDIRVVIPQKITDRTPAARVEDREEITAAVYS